MYPGVELLVSSLKLTACPIVIGGKEDIVQVMVRLLCYTPECFHKHLCAAKHNPEDQLRGSGCCDFPLTIVPEL